jgi:cytochrome c2
LDIWSLAMIPLRRRPKRLSLAMAVATLCVGGLASAAARAEDASAQRGATLFRQRCSTCHAIAPGPAVMGPNLAGVFGRKSGAGPGYAYSKAMRQANLTWTRQTLDRFLAAPAKAVPGSRMMVSVPAAADRAAIVAFLAAR